MVTIRIISELYYPEQNATGFILTGIAEGLAFSIPVISCNHKGIPEMVERGRTGLFVKPKAPRSIASAIIDITEDSGRYSNMSLAAREHYEANFKRDVHLEKLIQIIDR